MWTPTQQDIWQAAAAVVPVAAITLFSLGCARAETSDGAAALEPVEQSARDEAEATATGAEEIQAPDSGKATRLSGIDVSQFQGEIDWHAVKASGVVFAYARALEGETLVDSRFADNWSGMKEAGVVRGAYDFYIASDPVADQVESFTNLVALEPGDLAPMVDIESASVGESAPPDLVADFHRYLELVEAHYGVKPIIYTDPDFWNEYLDDSFGDYPLWVAVYDVDGPTLPDGWTDWVLWQHSDQGSVPGIDGDVDLDVFHGDLDELAAYRIPQ